MFARWLLVLVLTACVATANAQDAFGDESAADAKVIENLRDAGSNLSKPHPTRYYFYFSKEQQAHEAVAELGKAGYVVEKIERPPRGQDWLVLVSKPAVPSLTVVTETSRELNALARKYSGVYDGWEAAVTK